METLVQEPEREALALDSTAVPETIVEHRGLYHFVIDHSQSDNVIADHIKSAETTGHAQIDIDHSVSPKTSEYSVYIPYRELTAEYVAEVREHITAMGFTILREYQEL